VSVPPDPIEESSDALLSRFGLTADVLQRRIERDARYAYWFTTGRCSPGAWAALAIMGIGIGVTTLCAVVAGAHQLLGYTLMLGAPALLIALFAGQVINRVIKRRLSRLPRGLQEYEQARRLRRWKSETAVNPPIS